MIHVEYLCMCDHWASADILKGKNTESFPLSSGICADMASWAHTHQCLNRKMSRITNISTYIKEIMQSVYISILFSSYNVPTQLPALLVWPGGQVCKLLHGAPGCVFCISFRVWPLVDTNWGWSPTRTQVWLLNTFALSSPAHERPSTSRTVPGGHKHRKLPGTFRHWYPHGLGDCAHSSTSDTTESKYNTMYIY